MKVDKKGSVSNASEVKESVHHIDKGSQPAFPAYRQIQGAIDLLIGEHSWLSQPLESARASKLRLELVDNERDRAYVQTSHTSQSLERIPG